MQYRKLGHTDIDVSVICLGTMTYGEQNTEAEAHAQLDMALDHGVNFIDTAELYPVPPFKETQGKTEQYIGSWLKNQARDKIILATKVAGPGDWVRHIRPEPRLDTKNIDQAVETSLKRLQTDHIDLYQLHWPERPTNYFGQLGFDVAAAQDDKQAIALQVTLEALKKHVDAGRIRYIGLSNETPWGAMQCLKLADQYDLPQIVSIQNPYNLLNRTFEVGLAEVAYREQCGLLAYSPLGFGVLTGKYLHGQKPEGARLTKWSRFSRYNHETAVKTTQRYVNIAKEYNLDPAQMALAFVNQQAFVTANIIGATDLTQLENNIKSIELELNDEVLKAIETIHESQPNPCP